jgi:PAS domain-containing protein
MGLILLGYRTQMRVERSRSCQALQGVPLRTSPEMGLRPALVSQLPGRIVEAIHGIGGRKMSELGRVRDRGENTLFPDLLGWMGAAFGDAVELAAVRPLRLGRAQMEDVIRALPAAIYTTDAAGRITFYNEAAAELWGCRPELEKSQFCGSWKLFWPVLSENSIRPGFAL